MTTKGSNYFHSSHLVGNSDKITLKKLVASVFTSVLTVDCGVIKGFNHDDNEDFKICMYISAHLQ